MGHDDPVDNQTVQCVGTMYALLKARFGNEAARFLQEELPRAVGKAVQDPDEIDVEEAFTEACSTLEKEFTAKSTSVGSKSKLAVTAGCEFGSVIFQHLLTDEEGGRFPHINLHVSTIGGVSVIACTRGFFGIFWNFCGGADVFGKQ